MSDPYGRAKGGRLTFKGGAVASRSRAIDKKKSKKKSKKSNNDVVIEEGVEIEVEQELVDGDTETGDLYTIDAAKKLKYDQLFPVETKRFGYDPKAKSDSVEQALDDRVKKKADRYCK